MKLRVHQVKTKSGEWRLAIEDSTPDSHCENEEFPLSVVRFDYINSKPYVMDGLWNDEYSEEVVESVFLGEVELPRCQVAL